MEVEMKRPKVSVEPLSPSKSHSSPLVHTCLPKTKEEKRNKCQIPKKSENEGKITCAPPQKNTLSSVLQVVKVRRVVVDWAYWAGPARGMRPQERPSAPVFITCRPAISHIFMYIYVKDTLILYIE